MVWLAPNGLAHAAQDVPHAFTLESSWQMFEQAWDPVGQPPQGAFLAMHAPLHRTRSVGQDPLQAPETQVAVPFVIIGQDVHEDAPHVAGSELLTHLPLQSWKPFAQAMAQVPPMHAAVPWGSPGHTVQASPHAVGSAPVAQRSPHA